MRSLAVADLWPRIPGSPSAPDFSPPESTELACRRALMSAAATDHAQANSPTVSSRPHPSHAIAEPQSRNQSVFQQMESASHTQRPTSHNIGSGAVVAGPHATTADDALNRSAQSSRSGGKETSKRSVDYVLRSGLAGGLAGCAVRFCPPRLCTPDGLGVTDKFML